MHSAPLPEPDADIALIEAVAAHFHPLFGEVDRVFHEASSEFVHIDLHRFERMKDGTQVYVTTGMASRAMNVPTAVPDPDPYRYAELVLFLPADWPSEWEELQKPENFWPLEQLSSIARLPHARESWVWGGHTVMTDEGPFAPDTRLSAVLVSPSYLLPEELEALTLEDGRYVVFLTLAFLYPEECDYARANGSDALMEKVQEADFSPLDFFVLNKTRPSAIT